jgi:phage protein D
MPKNFSKQLAKTTTPIRNFLNPPMAVARRFLLEMNAFQTVTSATPRGLYPTREAAKTAAKAVYEKLTQKTYTFTAEIPGNPNVLAESNLRLTGFRTGIPTAWIISRSTHFLNSAGYKTSLEAMIPKEYQQEF